MKFGKLLNVSLVLAAFGSGEPYAAELASDTSWHTIYATKASQEPPRTKYEGGWVDSATYARAEPTASSGSGILPELIARAIIPIELAVLSTSDIFSVGLFSTITLRVENKPDFHLRNRTAETEQLPDSMRKLLLSSQSDMEYDIKKVILNERLRFKRTEEIF